MKTYAFSGGEPVFLCEDPQPREPCTTGNVPATLHLRELPAPTVGWLQIAILGGVVNIHTGLEDEEGRPYSRIYLCPAGGLSRDEKGWWLAREIARPEGGTFDIIRCRHHELREIEKQFGAESF